MRTLLRTVVALLLGCTASLGLAAAPSTAAATVTVRSLTAYPQVGGELTLLAQADGTTAPSPADVRVERWSAGPTWTRVDSDARVLSDGSLAIAVPLKGAMGVTATAGLRVVTPAATSDRLDVYVFADGSPTMTSAPAPVVTGTLTVGSVLTATTGTWAPTPSFIGLQWNRNGVKTSTGGPTYTVTAADLGQLITVTAVAFPPAGSGGSFTARDSRPTQPITRGTFTAPQPLVVGRAAVGETLRADTSAWRPTPVTTSYRWTRNGTAIAGASALTYTVTAADAGAGLAVSVRGEAENVEPVEVTSATVTVPAVPPGPRLGDLMRPATASPLPADAVQFTHGTTAPGWTSTVRTRWDDRTAFTHAGAPQPFLTMTSAVTGQDLADPTRGGEYDGTNASVKNIDVAFTITARRFAIAYRATRTHDAMVWLDDRPISARPIVAQSANDTTYTANWVVIELPARATTRVRFAGPLNFVGVDVPAAEAAVIKAAPPRLTVGVLSDSYFDVCAQSVCVSRAAVPTLGTQTGWRVWNLAEVGTGYLSASNGPTYGSFKPGPFGGSRRLAAVERAPLDLLLVNGSINDASTPSYSAETHRAAVDKLLDDLARLRPDLPVVLIGIEPLGRFQTGIWDERSRSMNATLASMVGRHANVIAFIDPLTDRWLTGTGSISEPKGDGNQDEYIGTDGVHPSIAGVSYYVGRVVAGLKDVRLP